MSAFEEIDSAFLAAHGPPMNIPFGGNPADEIDTHYLDDLIRMIDTALLPTVALREPKPRPEPKKSRGKLVYNLLFYAMVAVAVFTAFTFSTDGIPRTYFGFSFFTVLTKSMQSEIPQGSFVLTRRTDPGTLQIGDDITYVTSDQRTITHRIIAIDENHAYSGKRGFETKGIENRIADKQVVPADNVVGKVIFHNLAVGKTMSFVKKNMIAISIFAALFLALALVLRIHYSLPKKKPSKQTVPAMGRLNVI